MKFQGTKYPGSYLITPDDFKLFELVDYEILTIGKYKVYYSNEVRIEKYELDAVKAILLGYCFDTRDSTLSQGTVVENLMMSETPIEDLEYINGRYFLIMEQKDNVTIFSDASQLQPLVYHADSRILSSHDNLLSSVLSINGTKLKRRPERVHTELDFTRYEEIYKFNPSLKLDLNEFSFTRIYPRYELIGKTSSETFTEMKPLLINSRDWLMKQPGAKFLTITAGIDSRVSAALSRDFSPEIEFLTYYTPAKYLATKMAKTIHKIDTYVTKQMKENMQWNHSIISIRDYTPTKSELERMRGFYNSHHAFGLIEYYRNEKKYNHALHIKSTVFGMGKADFDNDLDKKEDT